MFEFFIADVPLFIFKIVASICCLKLSFSSSEIPVFMMGRSFNLNIVETYGWMSLSFLFS